MDLLTFLRLGKRLRRLVTVFVLAPLRLANEYYTIGVNIYFEKKKDGQFLLNCVLMIASVINPTRPIILSASISIVIHHNMDILYCFSFD